MTSGPVFAAAPTPTPTPSMTFGSNWRVDPEVTMVGKNSERARQFLFWTMTHSSNEFSSGIAQLYNQVSGMVIGFSVLFLVAVGLGWMIFRRGDFSFTPWIPKIAAYFLWALLAYVVVVGIIGISEWLMGQFIKQVIGSHLFNINFAGQNSVDSYKNFVGWRDYTMTNTESAETTLLLVRLTTFTYNFLSVMLILRKIILWFLIIVAPILSLLFPFVFIRNIGWIWVGEFFRWLFYGPLVAIFMAALVKIWEAGIPYKFDFSKTGKEGEIVYPTAVNILIGGPAQQLSALNSANYVDTYAEYVIALVMLWAVILVPFLLLRIFRDYCCDVFRTNEAALWAMYDKLKGLKPPPPPGSGPTPTVTPAGTASLGLPFRQPIKEERQISEAMVKDIARQQTEDIVRSLNLSVSSIKDIARVDMNRQMQTQLKQNLSSLNAPGEKKFSTVRAELTTRATRGDLEAKRVLQAAEVATDKKAIGQVVIPRTRVSPSQAVEGTVAAAGPVSPGIRGIHLPSRRPGQPTAKESGLAPTTPAPQLAKPATISIEEYEDVKKMWLNNYLNGEVPQTEIIKKREDWIKNDVVKLSNAIELINAANPQLKNQGYEQMTSLLPFILLGGFSETETVTYLKAKLEAAKMAIDQIEKSGVLEQPKLEEEKEKVYVETKAGKAEEAKTSEMERQEERPLTTDIAKDKFPV